MDAELLTDDEHSAMRLTADLANLMGRIIGNGVTKQADWQEACYRIHGVQQMILSQAAARAYPELYRRLGHTTRPAYETCDRCNYDRHLCPGCGVNVPHGTVACEPCAIEDQP